VEAPPSLDIDIVCVDPSPDILAYLREVLRRAGYGVTTTTNVADSRIRMRATRLKVGFVGSAMRSLLADELAGHSRVVELSEHFSTEDAGEAAQHVLDQVGAAIVG
jgi:DNA-binding NtrC family response regulator